LLNHPAVVIVDVFIKDNNSFAKEQTVFCAADVKCISQSCDILDGKVGILTGETGAGKSIIIGSVNMALGGKASKDSIRQGADNAYIELLF